MLTEAGETFQAKEKEIADLQKKLSEDKLHNEEEVSDSLTTAGSCSDSVLQNIYMQIFMCLWVSLQRNCLCLDSSFVKIINPQNSVSKK